MPSNINSDFWPFLLHVAAVKATATVVFAVFKSVSSEDLMSFLSVLNRILKLSNAFKEYYHPALISNIFHDKFTITSTNITKQKGPQKTLLGASNF